MKTSDIPQAPVGPVPGPDSGSALIVAATAGGFEAPAQATVRARAFAEPLLAAAALDTGENILSHADAVAAILAAIGGSEAMQAACYLVYACEHLNKPQEVITKAFGGNFAELAMETTKLVHLQRQARLKAAEARQERALRRATKRPCRSWRPARPKTCARCCWRSRAICGW
jgi:GTP pyrophosphokinase